MSSNALFCPQPKYIHFTAMEKWNNPKYWNIWKQTNEKSKQLVINEIVDN